MKTRSSPVGQSTISTSFGELVEDHHLNHKSLNAITFYLRVETFDTDQNLWVNQLDEAGVTFLEVTATEPETNSVRYVPLRLRLSRAELNKWIQPPSNHYF